MKCEKSFRNTLETCRICYRMQMILFYVLVYYGLAGAFENDEGSSNSTNNEAFQNNIFQFSNKTNIPSHSKEIGHLMFIDKLIENHDRRAWPTYGTKNPTIVTVNIHINSIGSVSAANMDFGMDIYLRQSWIDPRLQFYNDGPNETVTLNGQDIIDKIWKPDLFFRNLKSGNFHTLTVPNKLIKLSPNGTILFSMRLTLRLSCHMSFRLYPLDTQRCWVVLGSYAQTVDQVIFKWREVRPITIEDNIEVPEFHVVLQKPAEFRRDIDTGVAVTEFSAS